MRDPASTLFHLQQRRDDKLRKLAKAVKSHRGRSQARRDAIKATNSALQAFIRARKAETKDAGRIAQADDLFSLELTQ